MIIVFQDKIEWKERKNKLRTACGACRDFYVLCAEAFSVVLVYSAECRPDVLRLGIANDIVNRIEDITSALGQNIQTLDNLCCNFFRIATRERRLRVNAAAPEYQLIAVFTA